MERLLVGSGAILGFLAVAAGAFGAHALKTRLSPDMLDIFEIAVRYQMYHALAMLAIGLAGSRLSGSLINLTGWCFLVGIIIFSGSLYALALSGQRWLGAVTPLGGLALLAGWAVLAWAVFNR